MTAPASRARSAHPSGHLLDSFARAALWDSGLDYLHGTGHGVGCFLNVHEGPCGISYKTFADEPLEAGMIVSDGTELPPPARSAYSGCRGTRGKSRAPDSALLLKQCDCGSECLLSPEPGYYEDGAFGIRIENVVLVVPAQPKVSL